MQKKIIALAVAAVASSAAFAQSNVTVYGIVDQALTNSVTTAKQNTIGMTSGLSTSRIGFKGVEDLGNGNKALFVLEYGLTPNTDSGVSTSRQSFVGMTGDWGTAVAGRAQTTGYDWAVKFDPLAGSQVSALQAANAVGTTLIGATATAARANNAVAYISPAIAGVTFAVNHSVYAANTADAGSDSTGARANLYSATYNNGPLSVGAVVATLANETLSNTQGTYLAKAIGASYDFGVAKVSATHQCQEENQFKADANKWSAQSLSAAVPVSAAGTVVVSLAKRDLKGDNTTSSNDVTARSLAYTHALSKRTTAYAAVRQTTSADGVAAGTDKDNTLMAVGLRHAF